MLATFLLLRSFTMIAGKQKLKVTGDSKEIAKLSSQHREIKVAASNTKKRH